MSSLSTTCVTLSMSLASLLTICCSKAIEPGPIPESSLSVAGTHFHVSSKGSDSGPGSPEHPWKSIQYASANIGPGAVVHVAPGEYVGQIVTRASGTPEKRIVYLSDTKWGAHVISPDGGETSAWQNFG